MALKLVATSQFKKDYRRAKKRGLPMSELQAVLDSLCAEEQLEERHRDHALTGNYLGFRECHVRPDWLFPGPRGPGQPLGAWYDEMPAPRGLLACRLS